MIPSDLEVRYSGGASNSDPLNSLGGVKSSVLVSHQSVAAPSNVTGVTILSAGGLPSSIDLFSDPDGANRYIGWRGPDFVRAYTYVTADVEALVPAPSGDPADGFMVLDIDLSATPATEQEDTLAVTTTTEGIFPDVTSGEAGAGDTQYRCVYIHNGHGSETIATLKLWIGKQYDGEQNVALVVDSNGVGGTANTILDGGDSTNVLGSHIFSSPTTEGTAIEVSGIGPGVAVPIWIRRTVSANVQEAVSADSFGISMAAYV